MKTVDYLIIVASSEQNMKLGNSIREHLEILEKTSKIIDIVSLDLPMYTSQKEDKDGIPKVISSLVEEMKSAKAYIFVAPEYNYTIPPSLTNFVAWVSRVGDDFRVLFSEKAILNATFSGGGGADVLNAMRVQFTKLGAMVMPREVLANYAKPLNTESLEKTLLQLIKFSS
ncbi:NAD(P)H-dependent oxidoreductase [Sulfurimonas sp. SAG-AH-194-C20]|nr:NAD(P)H-dependent oxidoreductase [Sulfurimonas sp. SAG-AH-194-C20]MDF1878121.1 NAD(P)H-dependent oxidoreductase [Sulfurimonas sp. SAG-AH-194-C20]